jgi:flagellar assembly factor FliW
MIIESRRFGSLEVPSNKVIQMTRPIIGFEHLRKYCVIEMEALEPFLCLQSTEDPGVGFIIVNPRVFFPDYSISVNRQELADLNISSVADIETFAIVTCPDDPTEISVNLQGPVLINTRECLGRQMVLVNSEYDVKNLLLDSDIVNQTPEPELVPEFEEERELVPA